MKGAVAVDLGATSGRIALGTLEDGVIRFSIARQIAHAPREENGHLRWEFGKLQELVREAAQLAHATFGQATLGIDSWAVDVGYLDAEGDLLGDPICYRDPSHEAEFALWADRREELYRRTGIQHQPFNTFYQLSARRREDPAFPDRVHRWLLLPDLLGYLLTREAGYELTNASTTQLMGLDGAWDAELFGQAGWPVPTLEPAVPGCLSGYVADGVRLAVVGSHDTASAVLGLEPLDATTLFLNIGTWSLVGMVVPSPIATPEAEAANLSNERCVDGQVRLLKNVPGFFVLNALHRELGVGGAVGDWIADGAQETDAVIDLFHADYFNPASMRDAIVRHQPALSELTPYGWAEIGVRSMAHTIADQIAVFQRVTGRAPERLRIGGGGSQSPVVCQAVADACRLPTDAGPAEATVLGNLAMQFFAQGQFAHRREMAEAIVRSSALQRYLPGKMTSATA